MREFHGSATRFVDATPETVFDLISDFERDNRRVIEDNRRALRFAYQSRNADWMWSVTAVDGGAQMTVVWDAHATTFRRRRQLSKEVPASLDAITQQLSRRSSV